MSKTKPITYEAVVRRWKNYMEDHLERNERFLNHLNWACAASVELGDRTSEQIRKIHDETFDIVDCTKCANCCRAYKIHLRPEEAAPLAARLGMSEADFISTYLEPVTYKSVAAKQEVTENGFAWQIKGTQTTFKPENPCPFLKDNKCSVYAARPLVCRGYPLGDNNRKMVLDVERTSAASIVCPAVFRIVEDLRKQMSDAYLNGNGMDRRVEVVT